MLFEWQESLYTGVLEIDNNNRELFRKLNDLIDACNMGKGREEVKNILKFLEIYVNNYLNVEEKYMMRYGYLDNIAHKGFHRILRQSFDEVKRQFQENGTHNNLTLKVMHMLINWIISHVNREDKQFAAFLREKAGRSQVSI